MPQPSKAELLRLYFKAYVAEDRETIENGFADDFTFTSPYDDAIDKATWFERCWPNAGRIKTHDIEKIIVEGDEAFVLYRAVGANGREFRNSEFFTFRGEQITSVQVFFGAAYEGGRFVGGK